MSGAIIKIKNLSGFGLPKYETLGAAGMDVRSSAPIDVDIEPNSSCKIPTGLYFSIPNGYEIQVRSRSGLAAKHSISVLNSPGTIDSDYRGELIVILHNHHKTSSFRVSMGDRIAQILLKKVERIVWENVSELDSTERGEGKFGSTGVK